MSSLKDAAAVLQPKSLLTAQNNSDMSVTLPVSHVEMWPYAASAAVVFESHSASTCRYASGQVEPARKRKGGLGSCMDGL